MHQNPVDAVSVEKDLPVQWENYSVTSFLMALIDLNEYHQMADFAYLSQQLFDHVFVLDALNIPTFRRQLKTESKNAFIIGF